MSTLLEELSARGRIDAYAIAAEPTGIREAVYCFQRQLGAGLFQSREDPDWLHYVERAVTLVALDDYPSYREMALAWVAAAVLAQENDQLAQEALGMVLSGMFKPAPGSWVDSIAAAMDGMAREIQQEELDSSYVLGLLEHVEAVNERGVDPRVPRKAHDIIEWRKTVGLPVDPWAFSMCRRSAVAAVLYRRGDGTGAERLLRETGDEGPEGSYAGFRTLARLSLACCWLEWQRTSEATQQIDAARSDAHHMLDPVLRQERLDLVDKLRRWITTYGTNPIALNAEDAMDQVHQKIGMERRLYVEFLAALWSDDAVRLKRLLPLALEDATTCDAVFGRLLGLFAQQPRPGTFLALVRVMSLADYRTDT